MSRYRYELPGGGWVRSESPVLDVKLLAALDLMMRAAVAQYTQFRMKPDGTFYRARVYSVPGDNA